MIRRWFRFVGLLLGLIACVPLHYSWKLVGAKSPWPRRFLFWVGYVAGVRLNVQGEYRRTNTLFVANHATWLDIMIIGGTTGAAFVAKEELKTSKFVHWMASLNDSIWIQRSDRSGIHGQVDVIRKVLEIGPRRLLLPGGHDQGRERPSCRSAPACSRPLPADPGPGRPADRDRLWRKERAGGLG
jgi:1-acyl-sn-glycerol-3-phosphate acyltransferase